MLFRTFENFVDPLKDEAPTRPPTKLVPFIWHYAKPFRWLFLLTIVTSMLIAIVEVFAFERIGHLIDLAAGSTPEAFFSEHGGEVIAVVVMIALVWPFLSLLDELGFLQGIMGNMPMSIRWRGHRYLLRQSSTFFADDFAGRIATKLMQTALGARETAAKITNLCVWGVVYFGSAVVLFFANDWRLVIPLLAWLVAYLAAALFFLPKLAEVSKRQSDDRSMLTGRIVDAYSNIGTVKLFSTGPAEDEYAREGMQKMLGSVYPQMRLATGLSMSLHVMNGFMISGVLTLGLFLWSQGALTVGAVAFAATLALRLQAISHYFLWEVANLFENIGMTQDGMETLSAPLAVTDKSDNRLSVPSGRVVFEDVYFHYGKEGKRVISGLSLDVAAGEKVGLVGRSGAGKSTLVNLLLRLHDVEGGRVLIDGQNVADVTQDSLRGHIGVVTQDTALMHRSIRENIAYGRPGASEDAIIAAAKKAEAWEFIQELEDKKGRKGLDAHVGERGVKLSGGQRQRIAIARVILKDAPILVLDEATSALDSEVEAAIQGRMDELMGDKTVIAIAHRLSTIAAMDRLIVLDNGEIIEQGSHEELLQQGGLYAALWRRQSGGFIAADEQEDVA
ncbi:ABC transporter ATP-binding protein [Parvularcula lutaonensis]|uniref:ABC transporter ATP-binding protein n=1 Tax=Parvularcula lutaonensis TaxID=491923 RepID=A0ABV7MCV3_9PROT|nr:ABC transporter ATP-binding protein [Parvularcula lutaonensis]GGY49824.1 ABC transporter ATP-binding protein [Parvularcula lutaonensis]